MQEIIIDGSHLLLPDQISKKPVLIIHGGGFRYGEPAHMRCFARPLLAQGHPCLLQKYRLTENHPWPALLDDNIAGLKALCAGLDGRLPACDRAIVVGASAGGYLAMAVACAVPALVAGVVNASGIFNLQRHAWKNGPPGESYEHFFGHAPSDSDWQATTMAPVTGAPPLLCLHASEDSLVHIEESESACAAWRAVGSQTTLVSLPGGGPKNHALHADTLNNDDPLAGNDLERRNLRPPFAAALSDWCARLG